MSAVHTFLLSFQSELDLLGRKMDKGSLRDTSLDQQSST